MRQSLLLINKPKALTPPVPPTYLPGSPYAVWGFKKLVSGYNGEAATLIRSTGHTYNMGWNGVNADTAGADAWTSSDTWVHTLFDQTGNARNLTGAPASSAFDRPRFKASSAYYRDQGNNPASYSVNGTIYLTIPFAFIDASPSEVGIFVAVKATFVPFARIYTSGTNPSPNRIALQFDGSNNGLVAGVSFDQSTYQIVSIICSQSNNTVTAKTATQEVNLGSFAGFPTSPPPTPNRFQGSENSNRCENWFVAAAVYSGSYAYSNRTNIITTMATALGY